MFELKRLGQPTHLTTSRIVISGDSTLMRGMAARSITGSGFLSEGVTVGMKSTARLVLNKAFIQRYLDALSGRAKPPSLVNELVADERLRHYIGIIEAAFPKFEIFTEDVLGEEDKIVVRGTLRGIHSGELMGIAPA
jgi:hypothetical protein